MATVLAPQIESFPLVLLEASYSGAAWPLPGLVPRGPVLWRWGTVCCHLRLKVFLSFSWRPLTRPLKVRPLPGLVPRGAVLCCAVLCCAVLCCAVCCHLRLKVFLSFSWRPLTRPLGRREGERFEGCNIYGRHLGGSSGSRHPGWGLFPTVFQTPWTGLPLSTWILGFYMSMDGC